MTTLGKRILLKDGDTINADCKIVKVFGEETFLVNQVKLTGEKEPIRKAPYSSETESKFYQTNMVYEGSTVIRGKALAVIMAVGENTEYAKSMKMTKTPEKVITTKDPVQCFCTDQTGTILDDEGKVKPMVKESIKAMKMAGIPVIMLSGDVLTRNILNAQKVGMVDNSNVFGITSQELDKMTDDDVCRIIPKLNIVSEATAETKVRIVKLCKKTYGKTAMTGDGLNDILALREADIGIAVINATKEAKQAADVTAPNWQKIGEIVLAGSFYS